MDNSTFRPLVLFVFIKVGYKKCVILDCAEVFIERPKSLINQACTWSEYKHHNTIKFLVDISPTGYITFLSDFYGGRAGRDGGMVDFTIYWNKTWLWLTEDFKYTRSYC